jgi:hypothetical protein
MNQPIQNTAIARREVDTTMLVPKDIAGFYDFAADYFAAQLVPSSYKNKDQVAIAMIKGHEFGMLPAQSVDAFYVIGNRACPFGRAFRGLVQSSGNLLGEMDGYIEGMDEFAYFCEEPNPYKDGSLEHELAAELQRALRRRMARVKSKTTGPKYLVGYSVVKRRDQAAKAWIFDSFEASQMGLIGKSGPWTTTPGRMCMHRAATFLRSDVFADRLTGLDITAEEAMDLAIDIGTQPEPQRTPVTGGPSAVLADLARPETVIEVVQRPKPAAPVSAAAHAEIYAVGGPAPATDIPLESEEKPVTESHMDDAPPPQQTGEAKAPNGTAQLKAAAKAASDAGLDAAKIGQEAIEVLFGVGIKAKDLGDGDKIKVAQAILGKVEEAASGDAGGTDDAEF